VHLQPLALLFVQRRRWLADGDRRQLSTRCAQQTTHDEARELSGRTVVVCFVSTYSYSFQSTAKKKKKKKKNANLVCDIDRRRRRRRRHHRRRRCCRISPISSDPMLYNNAEISVCIRWLIFESSSQQRLHLRRRFAVVDVALVLVLLLFVQLSLFAFSPSLNEQKPFRTHQTKTQKRSL
jgi:hypothetical protein